MSSSKQRQSSSMSTGEGEHTSLVRPVWPNHPEGGPGATGTPRYVSKVGDDEAMLVRSFALNSYTVPTWTIGIKLGPVIDAHINGIVLILDEAELLGLVPVDVVDEAIYKIVLENIDCISVLGLHTCGVCNLHGLVSDSVVI
jgi:hypothetical protein